MNEIITVENCLNDLLLLVRYNQTINDLRESMTLDNENETLKELKVKNNEIKVKDLASFINNINKYEDL